LTPDDGLLETLCRKGAAVMIEKSCHVVADGLPMRLYILIVAIVVLISPRLHATGADTSTVPPVDPAACMAAIAANDDDKVVSDCGTLLDNEKTAKADRIKALAARAAAFARKDQLDRAIADDGEALRLEPQAEVYNSRGELWWKKGDRPKALADFGAAIKLSPDHPAAKGNYKRLAQELERLGALMAVAGKPAFNCSTAKRPVEKAICASPELANLDRQINAVNVRVLREAQTPRARQAIVREQDEFVARRNAAFGTPNYDLQKAMAERLQRLLGADGY
jgi:tetratricopeptide (TPR) repeat protein